MDLSEALLVAAQELDDASGVGAQSAASEERESLRYERRRLDEVERRSASVRSQSISSHGRASSGAGNGAGSETQSSLAAEERSLINKITRRLETKHQRELALALSKLDYAQSQADAHAQHAKDLESEINKLKLLKEKNVGLQHALTAEEEKNINLVEERDCLQDKVTALQSLQQSSNARHEDQISRLKMINEESAAQSEKSREVYVAKLSEELRKSQSLSSTDDPCAASPNSDAHEYAQAQDVRIASLLAELTDATAQQRQLKDEMVSSQAESKSKMGRMADRAKLAKETQKRMQSEIDQLKSASEDATSRSAAEVKSLTDRLESSKVAHEQAENVAQKLMTDTVSSHTKQMEDLEEKFFYAMESKRMESLRLADTQQELKTMETKHTQALAAMEQKIHLCSVGEDSDSVAKVDETLDHFRSMEYDRNRLKSELEGLKVLMESKLEFERQQQAITLAELSEERTRTKALEDKVTTLTEQLENDRASSPISPASQSPVAEQRADASPLSFFRCASRSLRPAQAEVKYACRSAIWQILNSIHDLTAFMCDPKTLKITEVSKHAFSIWGSGAQRSNLLTSLVKDVGSAEWLREEIASRVQSWSSGQSIGFFLQDLGCVEFCSKAGISFESTVCIAYVPPQPSLRQDANLVVVINFLTDTKSHSKVKHVPSSTPSVTSDDVHACDSVSNLLPNY
eukprot:TRINITY_DN9062_c0_g1_i1.p1 TRINITY_DN9062_c0_g1~~TRINITY_DN9062_c0_g1_i1.p1  ORF type:complete len:691 (+),score=87.05 TRINITY_DN9062_c0_g1_i1:147-2219(+)